MIEQNPSNQPPNPQDQFSMSMPPSHLLSDERWAPPKIPANLDTQFLNDSNRQFLIDTSQPTNIDTATIGMEGELPKGWNLEVTGFVGIGTKNDESDEPEYKIPIIKEDSNGIVRFTLMGHGENGKPKAVHTFSKGQPVHIGRDGDDRVDSNGNLMLSLNSFGINSGNLATVSRDHLTLTWTADGLLVEDHSSNGTKVEGIEKKNTVAGKKVGGAVTSLTGGSIENVPESEGLIDSVPKTAEEAATSLEARQEIERSRRVKPLIEQRRALDDKIDELRGKYTADQQLLMTRYANAWISKREAQVKGDGDGSYFHEGEASKSFFALPESARNDAQHVMTLMQQVDVLNTRILG